jgi:hypothetical protein
MTGANSTSMEETMVVAQRLSREIARPPTNHALVDGAPWPPGPTTPRGINPAMKEKSMAKLIPKQRANLPARDFGLPENARTDEARKETGNYPIPDRGHAISAKRLARKQRKAGNLTNDEFDRINRKADKVLKAE